MTLVQKGVQTSTAESNHKPEHSDHVVSGHTPTPWFHTGGDVWIDGRYLECCGRGHHECCGDPDVAGGQEMVAQTSEANAAFIVRAVNSHAGLIAALKKAKGRLAAGHRLLGIEEIDAALASSQTGGGQP